MGGGASIEIKHTHSSFVHITDSHFQELLASKSAREKLFQDIADYQLPGHKEATEVISLLKLVGYFTDNTNALYPGFTVNVDTLHAAFTYSIESFRQRQSFRRGKSIQNARHDRLTKAMFHSFLPTLLLFMRVWDVFPAADKLVVEDQKVFKGDFMQIKEKLSNVHEIVILGETSDENWEKAFDLLDRNKDTFISFAETCNFALAHIKRPFDYSDAEDESLLDEDEAVGDDVVAESFVEVISMGVSRLAPEIPEVPRIESPGQELVLPPASPRSPRSPRANVEAMYELKVDIDAIAEEGEALASARILFV